MKPIETCELPANAKVYFKEDKFSDGGYRIVYPRKDKDGNWLWKNFIYGGSQNLYWIILIIILVLGFIYVYNHDTAEMQKVVEDPCTYCRPPLIDINLNFEELPDEILDRQTG